MSHTSIWRAALVMVSAAALCLSAPRAHSRDFDVTPEPTAEPTYQYLVKATPTPEAEELEVTPEPEATATPAPKPTATPTRSDVKPHGTTMQPLSSISVAIEIGDPFTTADDLVPYNNRVQCSARLLSPLGGDAMNVVLTNSDKHLQFENGGTKNQLSLTLMPNGRREYFYVVGKVGSRTPGDAAIHAHRNFPNTAICGRVATTVWYTVGETMGVTAGSAYTFRRSSTQTLYGPSASGGITVYLRGRAKLRPVGLPAGSMKIGIVQNFSSTGYLVSLQTPSIKWGAVPKGTRVSVDETIRRTSSVPNTANDCRSGAWPLYDAPAAANTGVAQSSDTPYAFIERLSVLKFNDALGQTSTTITWNRSATINCTARDWVAIYIPSVGSAPFHIYPGAESNWTLNAVWGGSGSQKAIAGSSHKVTTSRIFGSDSTTANDILRANDQSSVTGTKTFVHP